MKPFVLMITVIAALILLGVIFMLSGPIKAWIPTIDVETGSQAEDFCGDGRLSDKITVVNLKGDCGKCKQEDPCDPFCNDKCVENWGACCQWERDHVRYYSEWECNVPGASGVEGAGCLVEEISHSQWVYNDCQPLGIGWMGMGAGGGGGTLLPIIGKNDQRGFTEYKVYDGYSNAGPLMLDLWENCKGGLPDEEWLDVFNPCFQGKCEYYSFVKTLDNFPGAFEDGKGLFFEVDFYMSTKCGDDCTVFRCCPGGDCPGTDEYTREDSEEEWHHYGVAVEVRYCCPEGYVWDNVNEKCTLGGPCGPDNEGMEAYGECWFKSDYLQSCDDACADHEMTSKVPDWSAVPEDCSVIGLFYPHECQTDGCYYARDPLNHLAPIVSPASGEACYYYNESSPVEYDTSAVDESNTFRRICACE